MRGEIQEVRECVRADTCCRVFRSSEQPMRRISIVLLFLTTTLSVTAPARASSTCLSTLTADQLRELDVMVFPAHPYSAHLSEAVDGDAVQGAVRRLTRTDIEKLRGAIARPFTGAVRDVR